MAGPNDHTPDLQRTPLAPKQPEEANPGPAFADPRRLLEGLNTPPSQIVPWLQPSAIPALAAAIARNETNFQVDADQGPPFRLVGDGGYSVVVARDGVSEVIKFWPLPPTDVERDPVFAMLRREVQFHTMASRTGHVPAVHGFANGTLSFPEVTAGPLGHKLDGFYLRLERMDGDLHDLFNRGGREALGYEGICTCAVSLADHLHDINTLGILQRDLKPSNILYRMNGERVSLKITDFGLARLVEEQSPRSVADGTPGFMSPERCTGGHIPRISDEVFALGALVHWMITDKYVVDRGAFTAYLTSRRGSMPPKIIEVDGRVGDVLRQATDDDPEKRHKTAGEFSRSFARAVWG